MVIASSVRCRRARRPVSSWVLDGSIAARWTMALYITADAEAFVKWHAGQVRWAEAVRDRRIQLPGPSPLVRAFPTWNARSAFAHIKPVSWIPASSAG